LYAVGVYDLIVMVEAPITVVEVPPFPSQADAYLSHDDRHDLIDFIACHPEAGDLIPGTGGLRKLRWAMKGGGKRGGLRLIYYFYNSNWPIFLLTIYHKSVQEDLTTEHRLRLRRLLEVLKSEIKQRSRK